MSTGTCKYAARHTLRRRKNYALIASILLLGIFAWVRLTEMDRGFVPLRPLLDAESEAKRLLALMTHYNYQCNVTAAQVGNTTQWPVCITADTGLNLDSNDVKLLYTIGMGSDYTLERTLVFNYSFTLFVVTRSMLPTSLYHMNNTHIVRTTIVANDPADFSRNSFTQRTLNDLLQSQGHTGSQIDLLRLTMPDNNAVQMWELLYYLINDDVLQRVRQLHLVVYIDKLDDDYLYNWYRTLYKLFTKSGFYLFHTSSHDTLCLQVTLMQSCVYLLSYIRNPGPQVYTMYPPADSGNVDQEWRRILSYLNTAQVECKLTPVSFRVKNVSPTYKNDKSCGHRRDQTSCSALHIRQSADSKSLHPLWVPGDCLVTTLTPVVVAEDADRNVVHFELDKHNKHVSRDEKLVTYDKVKNRITSQTYLDVVEVVVPGIEFEIIERLLSSGILQNVTQLMIYVELPDMTRDVHPTVLRNAYSRLRRIESFGLTLAYSATVMSCRPVDIDTSPYKIDGGFSHTLQQCFWIGYVRTDHF